MGSRGNSAIVGAVLLGVFLFSLFACRPAYGWSAVKSSNGLVVSRGSEDGTQTAINVTVYSDYKGGSTWTNAYTPTSPSAYNRSVTYNGVIGASCDVVEVPLDPAGGRVQAVLLSDGTR